MVKLKTTKYIRIVGYFGKVDNMNTGKRAELKARKYMLG